MREVVGGGQADFDEPWGELSADERVLLYACYNQLGHLEELTEAFRRIFASGPPDAEPIVVDLGCGPFTGGLAVSGALGRGSRFDYIGVDRSQAMRRFGDHLASAAERLGEMRGIGRHWFSGVSEFHWDAAPGWRPVFVIVSYLLASPTLNAVTLVTELEWLLERLGRGPVTVLYTNSPRAEANRSFPPLQSYVWCDYGDRIGEPPPRHEFDQYAYAWNQVLIRLEQAQMRPDKAHLVVDEGQDLPQDFFTTSSRSACRTIADGCPSWPTR